MIYYKRFAYFFFILSLVFSSTLQATINPKYSRDFWSPLYHGQPLNYCALDGGICGKALADLYCRELNYKTASQVIQAFNVGLTNYFNTKQSCRGWNCHGFKLIRCTNEMTHEPPREAHYREHRYVYPRYQQYRIDWCYTQEKSCGKKPAYSFCRRMGYLKAKDFKKEAQVPATRSLGTGELCFGETCSAYQYIICYR